MTICHRFVLQMAKSEDPRDHTLSLDVWDYDGLRRAPDFLGQALVDLTDLLNNNPDVKANDQAWYAVPALADSNLICTPATKPSYSCT